MKRVILLVLAVCVLAASGCSTGGVSTSGEVTDTASRGGVNVQENDDRTIEISLPISLMSEGATEELTQEEKDNGFLTKVITDDAVKYTIKKSKYDAFMKDYKKTVEESLDKMITDGTYPSVQEIRHTDDFGEITILVDKTSYENSFTDQFVILGAGLSGALYKAFAITSDPTCTVIVQDKESKAELARVVYPDALDMSDE